MSRHWIVAGVLGLGLLAVSNARAANPTTLPNSPATPETYTFTSGSNTWTVVISGCSESNPSSGVDCTNGQLYGNVTGNGSLVLTYGAASGLGNAWLTAATPSLSDSNDISLTETITTPTGKYVTQTSLGLTGSVTGGAPQADVATSENGGQISLNTQLGNGVSPYTVSQGIKGVTGVMPGIVKDMGALGTGGTAGTSNLNTVIETFNVPEPASLSLLALGFGGLVGLRRRRRRSAA